MNIYHYHPESGAFCGADVADPSPLDDAWLIPAHATTLAPPAPTSEREYPFFVNGAWELREPEPSIEERVEADRAAAEAADTTPEYHRQRMMEYPPITEFVDAMYWMRRGDESKMLEYEAKVAAVKDKYPKPEA